MKIYVWMNQYNGSLRFIEEERAKTTAAEHGHIFLGAIDLDIQKPKKTVKKELDPSHDYLSLTHFTWDRFFKLNVPPNAKNIKVTYEVEE